MAIRQFVTASSTIGPVVFTPAVPFVAGNVLVLATVERGSPPPLRDPGAGWTLVEGSIQGDANGGLGAMWYATSAGESSISLLWPKIDGIIWELANAAATPLDTTRATLQGASTTHSAGTFTSMPSSAVGLMAICAELNNAGAGARRSSGLTLARRARIVGAGWD